MPKCKLQIIENTKHCKYFVTRKKRYCRMTLQDGKEYCGEHEPCGDESNTKDNDNNKLRIVCPLDGKHTCYANKLKKHLKICNARPKEAVSHIVKGINSKDEQPLDQDVSSNRTLSNVSIDDMKIVINKINSLYEGLTNTEINEKVMNHEILKEELNNPDYGDNRKKHLLQASSILGILQSYNLLRDNTCFVEFGAGKGQLSYWISKSIENKNKSSVLLIERAAHRHKFDNKLDKNEASVHRIRADIGDLVLQEVNVVKESNSVVGVTKHLCGEATDLALRCLTKCNENLKNIDGIVMAFCCHHRCFWPSYTGKQFFVDNNLTEKDFDVMCGIVSWATCGSGLSRERNVDENVNDSIKQNDRDIKIGLTRNEKESIGIKCKYIINYGRMSYLMKQRYNCELFYYVKSTVTPENLCIVAVKDL